MRFNVFTSLNSVNCTYIMKRIIWHKIIIESQVSEVEPVAMTQYSEADFSVIHPDAELMLLVMTLRMKDQTI